jgi:hypothetical protein
LEAIAAVSAVKEASKSAAPVEDDDDDDKDDDDAGASAPDEKADKRDAGVALYAGMLGSDGIDDARAAEGVAYEP